MVKLTLYGGINEIGGNKILVEEKQVRVLFDFGQSFTMGEDYFVQWLTPRRLNGCQDYFEFGLLPKMRGLYSKQMLARTDLKYAKPQIDAVFLSHAHFDHMAHIYFLDPTIPVFCGHGTRKFMEVEEKTSSFTDYGQHEYRTFKSGRPVKTEDLTVEPVHVDHSIPGAYGFVATYTGGSLVYTGDLRRHGTMSRMTDEFVERAAEERPALMVSEGTRVAPEEKRKPYSEEEVLNTGRKIVERSRKLVVMTSYSRDIDRFKTFHRVAKDTGRVFVIQPKTAYLFHQIMDKVDVPDPSKDPQIRVYFRRKKSGTYDDEDYYKWEKGFLDRMVTADWVRKRQGETLLSLSFNQFTELIDIKPLPGSIFIHSMSEPFSEEDIEAKVTKNWIDHFKLKFHQLHASGHASRQEIIDMIEYIKPKNVVPIHTEHPELFKKLVGSGKVSLPTSGKELSFR